MIKKIALGIVLLGCMSFVLNIKKPIKLFMAGDSTMAIKDVKAFPEAGWGMPFVYFWDSTVSVVNLAKNGRSTKSFINGGEWKKIAEGATAGDYVFIQFGHNDEVPTKKNATTEAEFKTNLTRFVADARAKEAIPVLLTPVARRKFDEAGKVTGTHDVYAQIVREVAAAQKVPLIDLDKKAQALYQQTGVENSKLFFVHLKPGEHPNYPDGKADDTHFNELGARLVAQMVWEEIKIQLPDLAARAAKKPTK